MKKVLWICIALMVGAGAADAQSTTDRIGVQDLRYGDTWTRTLTDGSTLTMQGHSPINVKGYPWLAIGDGSEDDTDNIQAAIDSCLSYGGGVVYIPTGTYKITAALTMENGVSVVGDGPSTLLSRDYASHVSRVFYASGDSNLTIADLAIDGNSTYGAFSGTGSGHGVGLTGACHNISMIGLEIYEFNTDGIYIGGATAVPSDILVSGCTLYDNNRNGVTVVSGTGVRVVGNRIYDNYGVGVDAEPNVANDIIGGLLVSDNLITNSRVSGMGSGSTFFPRLLDVTGDDAYVNDVTVSDNILRAIIASPDTSDTLHNVLSYISQVGAVNFSNNVMETNRTSTSVSYGAAYFRDWELLSGHGNILKSRAADAEGKAWAIRSAVTMIAVGDTLGPVDLGFIVSGGFDFGANTDSCMVGRLSLVTDPLDPPNTRWTSNDDGPEFSVQPVGLVWAAPTAEPDTAGLRGLIWYDAANDTLKVYDGSGWQALH